MSDCEDILTQIRNELKTMNNLKAYEIYLQQLELSYEDGENTGWDLNQILNGKNIIKGLGDD